MKQWWHISAIALFAFHAVCEASNLTVLVGVDVNLAQRALGLSSPQDTARGIWLFADQAHRVTQYRFGTTFGGKVAGVGVGDPIAAALAQLGEPTKTFSSGPPGINYLFDLSGSQIRLDVSPDNKIEFIRVIKGTAQLTDIESVRSAQYVPNIRPGFDTPRTRSRRWPAPQDEPAEAPPPVPPAQVANASNLSVLVGTDAAAAERLLGINSTHDPARGIWLSADHYNRVYQYRFDSTFGGKVDGVGLGDPIPVALKKLGRSTKIFPADWPGVSYIFDSAEHRIQLDVNAENRVEAIRLLMGFATLTDADSVRAGIEVAPAAAAPAVVSTPSTHVKAECISLSEVQANMGPPVLYAFVSQCIGKGRLQDAAEVFRLAGLFWRFDVARVPDESAHGAGQVLIINTMNSLADDVRQRFGELALKLDSDEANTQKIVATARRLGPPNYYPAYMIMHGLNPRPLPHDFNAQQAWANLLATVSQSVAVQKARP